MSLRAHFDERIAQLRRQVAEMGARTLDMLRDAVEVVARNDLSQLDRLKQEETDIDRRENEIVRETVVLIMQESPVASDLRFLTATLGVVGEIESTADIALKLARCSREIGGNFPIELRLNLQRMGELARRAFSEALRLYGDYESGLVNDIEDLERETDRAYAEARSVLLEMLRENPSNAAILLRCLDAFHKLEHVGDRAHEICGRLRSAHEPAGGPQTL
ncbi:MAG: hypothetical protein H3C58_06000 [Fimbriimonadaceae bacterium]|nr:hypothetical protein [Fimbriimonadaceae bacterium]